MKPVIKATEKTAERPVIAEIAGLVKVTDGHITRYVKEKDLEAMGKLGYKKV